MAPEQLHSNLDIARKALVCVALVCLSTLLCCAVAVLITLNQQVDGSRKWLGSQISREGDATRKSASDAIASTRADVLKEVASLRLDTMKRIDAVAQIADARTGQALAIAQKTEDDTQKQIVEMRGDVSRQLGSVTSGVNLLTARYTALPDQVASNREVRAYMANGLGLIAAAKLTAGQTERTMRVVDLAMPSIIHNVDLFTGSSVKASEKTAELMGHLATATKPLPVWARIGLAVVPPVADVAAGAATAWSILH